MVEQKKALGKGLSSLIPLGTRSENGQKNFLECPLEDIIPNPKQPRKLFAKGSIDELAASIEEKGILQPLLVRRLGGGKYELIAGERRFRASQQLNLEKVPVIIKDIDENETLEVALIENIQRQDLNPIEESLAYKELLSRYQYTQDELAKRIGKDRSSIANSLRLLKLPDKIREYVITNQISMGHARALLAVESKELQLQIAEDIVANNLSVREIEDIIRKYKNESDFEQANDAASHDKSVETTTKSYARCHELENQIKEKLRSMVKIKGDGKKGQVVIQYTDTDQLNLIADKLLS